ncbi:MAG TPA: GH3 auxin-responsive promoter family protein [Pyrinomonadaceae bacterium]|jgi:hypothetical protein
MPLLLKKAIGLLGQAAARHLERAARRPELVQREFLFKLLRRNASTAFGRLHGFASLRDEAEFRRRVPIRDYEGFRPYVNRIMLGERRVLTASEPFMLTMTSGTTGEPKLIPVTRESRCSNARLMNYWFAHALKAHPRFLDQKGIGVVSQAIEGYTSAGLPYGSMSGLTYKNLPLLLRRRQAIPYEVFEAKDYDERYFLMARAALAAQVSFIATPNPSTLIRLAQVCDERKQELIRAIYDGTPGVELRSQPELLARLAATFRPDPARASLLTHLVQQTGRLRPSDCWSNLGLIACWIGGSSHLQARQLAALYGDVPLRDLGYMASEGHFTVPLEDCAPQGLLALADNYYEFIPEAETESARPLTLSSHELEEGARYSILLTTSGGLYRYRIGDMVEVAGFRERAPLLAFIRKEGEMASITGEKMHVNHLLMAVEQVRQKYGLAIEQLRAAPDFARSRYEVYLELRGDAPDQMLRAEVLPELDRALCRANIEYAQKRQSKRLNPPRLHLMARGWANAERRRAVEGGKRDAQYKWRILCQEVQPEDARAVVRSIEMEKHTTAGRVDSLRTQDATATLRRALVA